MFSLLGRPEQADFSAELRDEQDWKVGTLKTVEHYLDVVAFAVDPVTSLIAVGTIGGSIRIFGAPGVETGLTLPTSAPVKFLQFSSNLIKLVCIDENDKLYLWDLSAVGQIKLEATSRFERPVTSLTLSPSLSHAYIALETGVVKAYDLLCRRQSDYSIPNAWDLYEEELAGSGMIVDKDGSSRIPIDVVIHPRNLNLIFVAYGGGIVLIDIKERKTLRTYELLIPAGAPGGAGYTDPDLLKHRRPLVTSLTFHPAGHFFAVGHVDGCIAFWAVDDDSQPLLVRTLDDIDVQLVDGEKLEEYLPDGPHSGNVQPPHDPREPIFRLAWSGYPNSSDPRGGKTSLIILGGQFNGDPFGINALWLPAFNPPAPPASPPTSESLHPFFRKAMRESLEPLDAYFYRTPGLTQDFLLIPRTNPHFAGTFDPIAILLLFESEEHTRTVEAHQFPPPAFLVPTEAASGGTAQDTGVDDTDALEADLASTLQSMKLVTDPQRLELPPSLWSGPHALLQVSLVSIDRVAYETLSAGGHPAPMELTLCGGIAAPDDGVLSEIKYAKFEPFRVLLTLHSNLSICITDISVQQLIPTTSSPFTSACPRLLPALTIDVFSVLGAPNIVAATPHGLMEQARINGAYLTTEALEVAVTLNSGEVIVYQLRDQPGLGARERHLKDSRLVSLEHLPVDEGLRFKPCFMLTCSSPLSAFATSDIGFLAAAYLDGSLSVVNMRGPSIMLHIDFESQRQKNKHSILLHKSPTVDPVADLAWTICNLKSDLTPRVRLVAVRASGQTQIYTLTRDVHGAWSIASPPREAETTQAALPGGTFVLDARTGAPCKADKNRLAVALAAENASPGAGEDDGPRCLLVVAGYRGVRCCTDLGEARVSRAEWGSKAGNVILAQVVEKNGSYALVAVTDKHEALVYSLPALEFLHTLPLPITSPYPPSLDSTGDFVTVTPLRTTPASLRPPRAASPTPSSASRSSHSPSRASSISSAHLPSVSLPPPGPARLTRLDTLFNVRRGYHVPLVALSDRRDGQPLPPVPPQPLAISAGPAGWLSAAGSWFGGMVGTGSVSGDQIDAMLAGPDRPVPEKPAPRGATGKYADWEDKPKGLAAEAAKTNSALYNRLHAAISERGEMLGDLENSFNSLEEGSKSMVAQAKRLAAKETTKSFFSFR
ncbi:hypothetical protein FA95DRAFT_1582978 [Auriscalpium vulgare]|uniref:Uncharacterized protein n=1 Tax=Auriscalpium vulgare TaxID=40419 RepID=A0ACB8RQR9_9AGAM|nr:hypothetical protein FA95DRAFT_1582978 [Auriscalpium vulgare]